MILSMINKSITKTNDITFSVDAITINPENVKTINFHSECHNK